MAIQVMGDGSMKTRTICNMNPTAKNGRHEREKLKAEDMKKPENVDSRESPRL